jgi:hypothetical protein
MLNTDRYAEVIDRHVELASDLAWLGSLLDNLDPSDDPRQRVSRSHPAVQIEGAIDDDQLAQRLVAIAQLAEDLDRATLQVALRLVPVEWWAARLGTTAPVLDVDPGGRYCRSGDGGMRVSPCTSSSTNATSST